MKLRTEGGHFWITFENGYTLSVFNGFGSHTENNFAMEKFNKIIDDKNIYENYWESKEVEIAILSPYGDLVTQNHIESDDSVKTIPVDELPELMLIIKKIKY